jgi:ATP-binding protein involved in chromosome partitioning
VPGLVFVIRTNGKAMERRAPDPSAIRAALRQVALPGQGGSLAESDRLSEIGVRDGRVSFSIAILPEEAQRMEPVRRAAEAAVRALPGVRQVYVTLTADHAPAPAPQASPEPVAGDGLSGIGYVLAVASGKGGVGKSTTACNLALGLAAMGLRVGVLDADIYGPSMPRLFGLHGKPRVLEGRTLAPLEAFGVRVMSIGFLVEEETAMVWRGPMVVSAINQMLREVAWGPLDVLVVDLPPGTGDAQLAIAQAVPISGAVIVSTPQDLALIDARRGIAMFAKLDVPILGIVENMAHFVCTTCGTVHPIFGEGGARREAERLGVPFLGAVPLTLALRETSDAGRPVTALDPDGPLGTAYRAIAREAWSRLTAAGPARRSESLS